MDIHASPRPVKPDAFMDYQENIPGTDVIFEMVAIPGGEFEMGSPESEFGHEQDESPVRRVRISPFWMGRAEVSWDEWECYYEKTATMGKYASIEEGDVAVDATTGPRLLTGLRIRDGAGAHVRP